MEKDRESRLRLYSNLGALSRFTFDNMVPQGRSGTPVSREQFHKAYEASRKFVENPTGWLILVGPSGSGKTHLAAAIANERIKLGQPVIFQTVPDLLDHLRSTFAPGSGINYDELFERICLAPLLILDDMGVQAATPWAKEKLDQLLNRRFNSEMPTVITTGIPARELDDRLSTRLLDPCLSHIYVLEEKSAAVSEFGWEPQFELQKGMKFKNFDSKRINLLPRQRENLEWVYHEALEYAESPDGWLVLQGENGSGKTHLAAAIVNYLYEAGKSARFIVVPDFLDHLRSTFSPESKVSYDQLFESVKNASFLVLDDFGEQSTTPWAQEKLYQVINYRYNARLPTVITTSYSLEEIDSRVSSRLVDPKISKVLNITAPDYRGSNTSRQNRKDTPRQIKK
jgi:DNA replication protein DnaC